MNNERYKAIVIIFITSLLLETLFKIDGYLLIILMCILMFLFWNHYDKLALRKVEVEAKELLNQNELSLKDAHLKHKQIMTIIYTLPFPMLLLDIKGNVVIHNKYLQDLRVSDKEMTYLNNDLPYEMHEIIKDAYILEKNIERIIEVKDKTYQSISVPITSKSYYSGCLVMFQDITKVLKSEEMQRQFITDASHELKTPIAAIKGMLEILNRDEFDDIKTGKEFLKEMDIEINRLSCLVNDLLQISKLSLDDIVLNRGKIDFEELVKGVVTTYKNLLSVNKINIEYDFRTDEKLFCDLEKMRIVISNLISNAIKYSESNVITIGSYIENNSYVIYFEDNGVGIANNELDKVFDRFYRIDKHRARNVGGNGLGLSIVKEIIEAHKANISVESKLKHGSKFIIKFTY